MLCTVPDGARWRWLASEACPELDKVVLVERIGACPNDPDGDIVAVRAGVDVATIRPVVRRWLQDGWRRQALEGPARGLEQLPALAATAAVSPTDRRVPEATADALVAITGRGAARFVLFPRPA